ncbi:MAG: dihydroorotase [Desulfovibrio sp.]|nr:dihydroorotase [Desulfovibrio sp.]
MHPTDLHIDPADPSPSGILLTNAIIPFLGKTITRDILVRENRVVACAPTGGIELSADDASSSLRVDATGKLLFPSLIDAHTHLREPGFEYKEDIASGLHAAAYGGFGTVMAMGNTRPVNDTSSVTRYMLEKAALYHPHGPRLLPVGALTVGLKGAELAPMGELAEAGCVAFSNDGRPVTNTEIFRRAVEYAAQWGRLVIDHCEDEFLAKGAHMNEGESSARMGVKGQPTVAEALHVARDILLSEYLDLPIHLAHISCRQSVELIAFAKKRGIKITAETCPHYLALDETRLERYDASAKVSPPLRSPEDVLAVKKGVSEGLFDMFVTDHAPHAPHEKDHPLNESPNGFIGLETALPLTWGFVRQGLLSEQTLIRMWHSGPSEIFGIRINTFMPGDPADFFLFDPDMEWKVSRETLHSKSLNTPFLGQTLRGKVTAHWIGGRRII